MASQHIANLHEVSRHVISNLASTSGELPPTPGQVQSIYKCVGKFISYMFKKAHYDQVIADITNFGTVLRNNQTGQSEFAPFSLLASECHLQQRQVNASTKSVNRQELPLSKVALVTQIPEALCLQILQQTCKAIGHYVRFENMAVVCDLGISTGEVLVFESDRATFVDKSKLRDNLQVHQSLTGASVDMEGGSSTLRARMAARLESVTDQYDYKSSKASRYSEFDDMKSNVAPSVARSLSLAASRRPMQAAPTRPSNAFGTAPDEQQEGKASPNGGKYDSLIKFLKPRSTLASKPSSPEATQRSKADSDKPRGIFTSGGNRQARLKQHQPQTPQNDYELLAQKRPFLRASKSISRNSRLESLPSVQNKNDLNALEKPQTSNSVSREKNEVDLTAPFGKTFNYNTPGGAKNQMVMHPEIEHMLHATPQMSCLKAGSSDLAQATFKMMRNTNLARFQQTLGSNHTDNQYQTLRDEMLGRKAQHDKDMADYKQSVIDAKQARKRQQQENSTYWRNQMEWRKSRIDEIKKEPYDPELVWNIEGPERKKTDQAKRHAINMDVKETNIARRAEFYQRKTDERNLDKHEGQQLITNDLNDKDLEKQILSFKRQLFAQEMTDAWDKQAKHRQNMKVINNEK